MAMSKPAPEGSLYPGKSIAEVGLDAVESGEVNIFPAEWRGVYRQWLENIQDWCLSRQLWWGHQIPAWYDEAGRVYVARTEEEAQKQAGEGVKLTRDPWLAPSRRRRKNRLRPLFAEHCARNRL